MGDIERFDGIHEKHKGGVNKRNKNSRNNGVERKREEKLRKLVKEWGGDDALREKIKVLEIQEEARKRTEKRNNIVIKGWKVPKRDSLEITVEEMIKLEFHIDAEIEEAFWKRRGINMVTAKLKNREQKRF